MAEPLPELTGAQVEQFRDAYNVFDKDGDGGITTEELGYVMRALGQNPSDEEVEAMFADVDEASYAAGQRAAAVFARPVAHAAERPVSEPRRTAAERSSLTSS